MEGISSGILCKEGSIKSAFSLKYKKGINQTHFKYVSNDNVLQFIAPSILGANPHQKDEL